jgi:hypothetical protein
MSLTIHIRELRDRLHELDTATGEVIITSGSEVIARLSPRTNITAAETPRIENHRKIDPFAEWTAEDTQRAKAALASNRYRFTTEQVIACLRALEQQ